MLQAITCDCRRLHVQFTFEIYMISNHFCKYDAINCSFILQNGWFLLLILCRYVIIYTSNHTNDHNIAICMMCTPKGMGYEGVKNQKIHVLRCFLLSTC
jgi:hypothetical protein